MSKLIEKISQNTMKKLKDKNIKAKLDSSFRVIIVTFILTTVVAFIGLAAVIFKYLAFYNTYYKQDMLQMQISRDVESIGKNVLWSLNTMDETEANRQITNAQDTVANVDGAVKELAALLGDKNGGADLLTAFQNLNTAQAELISKLNSNDYEGALDSFNGSYKQATEAMEQRLVAVGEYTTNASEKSFNSSFVIAIVVDGVLLLLLGISVSVARFYAGMITQIIRTPVDEISHAARKLKEGELDAEITYTSKDELGKLSNDFRDACAQMRNVVSDAGNMLEQMAAGNFTVQSEEAQSYVGDFEVILTSMSKMNAQLSDTLSNIRESSMQVEVGAQQLSESAQALAEGATDQAASIEELTATIENVTAISEESAETAEKAASGMKRAEEEARGSKDDMQELTKAMIRISETSKEIEEIIDAIEDIASQTNLLALNASIEAARAGEAGRGFAVVADQIGKLAADSAKSAVNTRELISKSLEEIEHGNKITTKTASAIDKVVTNMTEFAMAASGSAQASRTQADMLKQIEFGIEQISGVVQNNSATAEETSAVSQELLAQSETLKNQVAIFTLKNR